MQSHQSLFTSNFMHYLNFKNPEGRGTFFIKKMAAPLPPLNIKKRYKVITEKVGNHNSFCISPKKEKKTKTIFYLHGGSYIYSFSKQHWQLMDTLIKETSCSIWAPDYPLAPDYTSKDAFIMIEALYDKILEQTNPEDVVFMGDSAGGGLILAFAQMLKKSGKPQPGQIILLSPWLDITMSNTAISTLDPLDPLLGVDELKRCGASFAGDIDPRDPMISPINGSFSDLAPLSIFTSTHDVLSADADKLHNILISKKIKHNFVKYPNMIHIWMIFNFPESTKAKKEIIQLLKV